MKILQVTTHFNMGGISRYILTLSQAQAKKGAQVIVASSGGDLEGELAGCGIPHYRLNIRTKFEFGPKALFSGIDLARIVKREKVDVLHAHTRVSQVSAAIASMITGVPCVTTCHGYFKKRSRAIVDTWGARVIAISDAVRKHLKDDLGVAPARIALIYSGVDERRFARPYSAEEVARIRAEAGLGGGPVIGTIGRLSPVKGQRHLIAAMKEILARRPGARCLIVGNGPEETSLKSLAASLGVDGSVSFVESCGDTREYLAAMDVFVFPSIKEGLGIALLEALAAGKACVASRTGGIEDIVTDGKSGLVAGPGDPSAIAGAVLRLLEDGQLRNRLGEEGRSLVRARFTLDRMADEVLNLYREVASR